MAKHVFLFRATAEGATSLLYGGSDSADSQINAIEELGGSVEAQYVVTGHYDLVLIADLPSDAAALAVSLAAETYGLYVEGLRAFSPPELDEAQALLPDVTEWLQAVKNAPKEDPSRSAE